MSRVESLLTRLIALERPLLVALDVDGTLAPIVRDPDSAAIPDSTMATLKALAVAPSVELALVTGRDLRSLQQIEQLPGIWRAVEHGGVVLAPGETGDDRRLTPAQREALDAFRTWVEVHAADAFVEYKPQAVAVHVRALAALDPDRAARLLQDADALAQHLGLHVRRGTALREAEAVPNDKGRALHTIMQRCGARSVFFAGDDVTDFPAIDLAAERGVGVFVRSDEQRGLPSRAATVLESVGELSALLEGLRRSLADGRGGTGHLP